MENLEGMPSDEYKTIILTANLLYDMKLHKNQSLPTSKASLRTAHVCVAESFVAWQYAAMHFHFKFVLEVRSVQGGVFLEETGSQVHKTHWLPEASLAATGGNGIFLACHGRRIVPRLAMATQ